MSNETNEYKPCCKELYKAINYKKSNIKIIKNNPHMCIEDKKAEKLERETEKFPDKIAASATYISMKFCPFCGYKISETSENNGV